MYCTIDDIKKLLPEELLIQLTDDEGLNRVNDARVDEAIAQAGAEIDSYCATKYAVPFATVPPIVKKCSVDMAIYNLYSRRVEKTPETRVDRYNNAVKLLSNIAKGVVSIGADPAPTEQATGDQISGTKEASDRVVTRSKMRGY